MALAQCKKCGGLIDTLKPRPQKTQKQFKKTAERFVPDQIEECSLCKAQRESARG